MRKWKYRRLFKRHGIIYWGNDKEEMERIWNLYKKIMGIK